MAYAKEKATEKQVEATARFYKKIHRVGLQIPEQSWEEVMAYANSMGVTPAVCIKACLARCMEADTGHAPSMRVSETAET